MRAVRAALLSLHSVRVLLPVLSRSSARAPSRLVSTEAAAEGSVASKSSRVATSRGERLVKEMTPIATFLGIVVTIGAVGAYYSSRLTALEERITGLKETITKVVDAKNTGIKDAVDAKNAGSEKVVDEKIKAFKEAADHKVRPRSARGLRARSTPLAHMPSPPPCSTRPSDVLVTVVAVSVAVSVVTVSVVFGLCILAALVAVAETKVEATSAVAPPDVTGPRSAGQTGSSGAARASAVRAVASRRCRVRTIFQLSCCVRDENATARVRGASWVNSARARARDAAGTTHS
jgi:hypothetical protein